MKKLFSALLLLVLVVASSGCSTRQVTDGLGGSTGQRLVTYSIEKWIEDLPDKPFESLRDQSVYIKTHFVQESEALNYATGLLTLKLQQRFQILPAASTDSARYELTFFFNSLGTDADYAGLSLPFIDVSGGGTSSRIDLLALDMYHGVSEGHYILKDNESGAISFSERALARVRADSLSTPILKIPVSNLE